MSKRRKNSGKGFGMMFGGAFGDKKDATKKARKIHGFVQPRNIKGKRRFVVMSERKNPIRRKRKNAIGGLMGSGGSTSSRMRVVFDPGVQQFLATKFDPKFGNMHATGSTKKAAAKALRDRFREARKSKTWRNPAELIVLGANPEPAAAAITPTEFVLPPNSTITIRTNPVRANAGHGYGYDFHGSFTDKADAVAKEKTTPGAFIKGRITPHGYRWIVMSKPKEPRTNVEFGEYDHGTFHPWTRRPKTRRKPAIRRLKQSNPSAAAIREEFVGAPADWETVRDEPHMPPGDYAQLGELLALYVKPGRGFQVQQINFKNKPVLVSDESARQLYFVGGDQDISGSLPVFGAEDHGGGHFQLGEVRRIDYKQRKEHVPHPDVDEWRHEFGEETGVRPVLWFDANTKRLLLKGGEYEIRTEGIIN